MNTHMLYPHSFTFLALKLYTLGVIAPYCTNVIINVITSEIVGCKLLSLSDIENTISKQSIIQYPIFATLCSGMYLSIITPDTPAINWMKPIPMNAFVDTSCLYVIVVYCINTIAPVRLKKALKQQLLMNGVQYADSNKS